MAGEWSERCSVQKKLKPPRTGIEHQSHGENRLLRVLPRAVRNSLLVDLDPVRLGFREPVYESNQPLAYVYFPLDGIFSIVTILEEDGPVEVATVGNEGFVGLPVFLGGDSVPGRTFCQIPGAALRMRARRFREHVAAESPLRDLLLRYTQAYLTLGAIGRIPSMSAWHAGYLLPTTASVETNSL